MKPTTSRRRFLRGAGGFTLGLPFLPSLETKAFGADAVPSRAPRFVNLATGHGALHQDNMFPPEATLTERSTLLPGHEIARGTLVRKVEGADASLSPVVRGPADQLTDQLVAKMNVLRGLDVPFYLSHHSGGHLGNYGRNTGGPDADMAQRNPMATIDQIMGWSPAFYGNLSGIRERVILPGRNPGFSFYWSDPTSKSGTMQELRPISSSRMLFDRLFVPTADPAMPAPPMPAPRPRLVDRVLEDYRRVRDTNRRISRSDKQRLDDHLSRLAELDRRIGQVGGGSNPLPVSASCKAINKPTEEASMAEKRRAYQLYNDVVVAGFLCGTSRIANIEAYTIFVPYAGDYHQDVAHQWWKPQQQATLLEDYRLFFTGIFLDLLRKLDVEEAPGITVLDNTLVAWTQESGMKTHDNIDMPVVTAGSAGGRIKTGQYLDYRNKKMQFRWSGGEIPIMYHGLWWNQWLGSVLQTMGIPQSEYARAGMQGYGFPLVATDMKDKYVSGALAGADQMLPFLKA